MTYLTIILALSYALLLYVHIRTVRRLAEAEDALRYIDGRLLAAKRSFEEGAQ